VGLVDGYSFDSREELAPRERLLEPPLKSSLGSFMVIPNYLEGRSPF
jgi:hypothetical protein